MLFSLVVLLSFLATIYVIVRNPSVQTFAVRILADYISRQTGTEVRIGALDLSLTKGLLIKNIIIKDRNKSDLFTANLLGVIPGRINLKRHHLNFERIFIDNGVIQLITHKNDTVLNLQYLLDFFISKDTTGRTESAIAKPWDIHLRRVELTDTRFHFQDKNAPKVDSGMDYSNIDVNHINLVMTDFHPDGDTLNATIKSLSAAERSGFTIHSMSGDFQVSPAFLKAHNLKLVTNHSNLDLSFDFLYKEWNDYSDFLKKVRIQADISHSTLDLEDIGAFAPVIYVMKDKFIIEGKVKGTVSNFHARNFHIAFGENTTFFGNINANGLPDVEETFIDLDIKSFTTTRQDIATLMVPGNPQGILLPDFLQNAGVCKLKGNFTGFYNDFVTSVKLNTDIGSVTTNLSLKKQKGNVPISYSGEIDVMDLHLGTLLNSRKILGLVSLRADIEGSGIKVNDIDMSMNVFVDSVEANKYTYRNLEIKGTFADKQFTGYLEIKDPNLALNFNGTVDLHDSLPSFNFSSTITHANLFALNLSARDSIQTLESDIKADFKGNTIDNIDGSITVENTRYIEAEDTIKMKSLSLLTSRDKKNDKSYKLSSDFVDADFTGEFNFKSMIPSLTIFIQNYLASFRMHDTAVINHPPANQFVKYNITLKITDPVMKVFLPFLRIAPDSRFEGFFSDNQGMITLKGASPEITIFGMHMNDWYIKATSKSDNLGISMGCRELLFRQLNNKDSLLIRVDSVHLISDLRRDTIQCHLTWFDTHSHSEIAGFVNLGMDTALEIKLNKLNVFVDKKYWNIGKDNDIVIDTSSITLKGVEFISGEQVLKMDGKISHHSPDTLSVSFIKLDISDFDQLLGNNQINIDGILTGKLKLTDVYNAFSITSDLRMDQFKFNGEPLGDATFKVKYVSLEKRFDVNVQILYTGNIGTSIPLSLKGNLFVTEKNPRMDLNLDLNNLNLKMVAPFVSSFMSKVSGLVSGNLKIKGSLSGPVMYGKLHLLRTEFRINYLNVPYSFADEVTVDSNYFGFNHITLFDSLGNKALLNGKITHSHFQNVRLDLNVDYKDFSAFRNTYAQNNLFYGKARASGTVRISGLLDNISVDVKARSSEGTDVVIPISSTADISQNDYIVFESHEKDTLAVRSPLFLSNPNGLSLDLSLQVNPNAIVEVIFPDQLGNIKGSGTGTLVLKMTPTTSFSLSGNYMIQKGTFLFHLKNYINLTFTILDGGSIRWTGDPTDADISMSAIYKTRVPLLGLTTKTEQSSLRVPVECIIRLNGKLMNPVITFGMNLPNAQEDIKSTVYTAIDTTNQAEMAQQVLNILVLGQFKTNQGATTNINVGTTSLTLLANQVNSLLSKISKNVNVGINYQRGAGSTVPSEFDVAVSTSLFSDRLLVDGLFGVNSYTSASAGLGAQQQQVSTIVGDINIEYLLTDNGRFRLKAFNRTNTIDILTNNALYTQGIGVSYQRDFNRLGDLFRKSGKKGK
ncbi:MAG: translocation/assembly module TamB domain-containing protein [Bacteroidetes bacterium]|nr:translocation/assembly module TamB domain-containing protein [Bacteroidota bacterium]